MSVVYESGSFRAIKRKKYISSFTPLCEIKDTKHTHSFGGKFFLENGLFDQQGNWMRVAQQQRIQILLVGRVRSFTHCQSKFDMNTFFLNINFFNFIQTKSVLSKICFETNTNK